MKFHSTRWHSSSIQDNRKVGCSCSKWASYQNLHRVTQAWTPRSITCGYSSRDRGEVRAPLQRILVSLGSFFIHVLYSFTKESLHTPETNVAYISKPTGCWVPAPQMPWPAGVGNVRRAVHHSFKQAGEVAGVGDVLLELEPGADDSATISSSRGLPQRRSVACFTTKFETRTATGVRRT